MSSKSSRRWLYGFSACTKNQVRTRARKTYRSSFSSNVIVIVDLALVQKFALSEHCLPACVFIDLNFFAAEEGLFAMSSIFVLNVSLLFVACFTLCILLFLTNLEEFLGRLYRFFFDCLVGVRQNLRIGQIFVKFKELFSIHSISFREMVQDYMRVILSH